MVPGILNLVKSVPDAVEMIAIEQQIEQWKGDNHGAPAIIVIDFAELYRLMCETNQAQLDILFGKHELLLNRTESMLRRFRNMGVQLEFFCRGPSRCIKYPKVIDQRRVELSKSVDRVFQLIKLEWSPEYIVDRLNGSLYNNASYFISTVMLAENYGHVHKSYHSECEWDIIRYATQHNAIAVISGNYNFILSNGQWSFWDLRKFDLLEFKILQINKTRVRDFLELRDDEMQLLSVLAAANLPNNLKNLLRIELKCSLKNIAKFITENLRNETPVNPSEIVRSLKPTEINKIAENVKELLKMYADLTAPKPVVEDELSIVVTRIHNSYVYEFLNDLAIPIQPLFLHKSVYKNFMAAAIEIYRRQMGFVLQHKRTELRRKVMCFNKSNITIKTVSPIYPNIEVPPLLNLYLSADKTLLETKLKLLCWIASDQLDYTAIENISKPYLCAILALVNMTENQFITSEEADCILYCLLQYNMDPESMNSLVYPNSMAKRPFQLVFLYDKFHQFMAISMNTVGLKDLLVYNQLDGVYFHQQYENFIHLRGAERDILLEKVKDYRIYLNK